MGEIWGQLRSSLGKCIDENGLKKEDNLKNEDHLKNECDINNKEQDLSLKCSAWKGFINFASKKV